MIATFVRRTLIICEKHLKYSATYIITTFSSGLPDVRSSTSSSDGMSSSFSARSKMYLIRSASSLSVASVFYGLVK